jgi:AraC-like DNA-binding protein
MGTPNPIQNYARYYPGSPTVEPWGVWISGSGVGTILPGQSYPAPGHPSDHHFDWSKGRILHALQIVLIPEGSGVLEFRNQRKLKIHAGMIFLLLPEVWHRYRPDRSTGWRESWIEICGSVPARLRESTPSPFRKIVRSRDESSELAEAIDKIHILAADPQATRPELSAEALRCLALLDRESNASTRRESPQRMTLRAERYLEIHHTEPIDMPEVARQLGVSYSSFRKIFLNQTGLTPWQYVVQIRIERARRMVASGDLKLDEIADKLGFSSAFHLSTAFKKAFGLSPESWRKQRARSEH